MSKKSKKRKSERLQKEKSQKGRAYNVSETELLDDDDIENIALPTGEKIYYTKNAKDNPEEFRQMLGGLLLSMRGHDK